MVVFKNGTSRDTHGQHWRQNRERRLAKQ